jgi:hypothetical protein
LRCAGSSEGLVDRRADLGDGDRRVLGVVDIPAPGAASAKNLSVGGGDDGDRLGVAAIDTEQERRLPRFVVGHAVGLVSGSRRSGRNAPWTWAISSYIASVWGREVHNGLASSARMASRRVPFHAASAARV